MGVKEQREFDPHTFLATIGDGRKVVTFPEEAKSSPKGPQPTQSSTSRTGKVRLKVVSRNW